MVDAEANKVNRVYSANEHSSISHESSSQQIRESGGILSSLNPKIDLPLDIVLETLFSVVILSFGIVLGSPELKPVPWRLWAGKIESEKQDMVHTPLDDQQNMSQSCGSQGRSCPDAPWW